MAGAARAEVDEIAQHLAGIVPAAAHLNQIGIAGEIARAHFRIGLEAARAGDHRLGDEVIAAVRAADAHAFDAAQVAMHGADRRIEPDLDPQRLRDLPPLGELADAAARHMDGDAALEIALVADPGVLL